MESFLFSGAGKSHGSGRCLMLYASDVFDEKIYHDSRSDSNFFVYDLETTICNSCLCSGFPYSDFAFGFFHVDVASPDACLSMRVGLFGPSLFHPRSNADLWTNASSLGAPHYWSSSLHVFFSCHVVYGASDDYGRLYNIHDLSHLESLMTFHGFLRFLARHLYPHRKLDLSSTCDHQCGSECASDCCHECCAQLRSVTGTSGLPLKTSFWAF